MAFGVSHQQNAQKSAKLNWDNSNQTMLLYGLIALYYIFQEISF